MENSALWRCDCDSDWKFFFFFFSFQAGLFTVFILMRNVNGKLQLVHRYQGESHLLTCEVKYATEERNDRR